MPPKRLPPGAYARWRESNGSSDAENTVGGGQPASLAAAPAAEADELEAFFDLGALDVGVAALNSKAFPSVEFVDEVTVDAGFSQTPQTIPEPEPEPEQEPILQENRERVAHTRSIPRWVMDEETDNCMACSTEFNFWTRRHHCRYCGVLVCGDCLAQGQMYSDRWVSEEDGRSLLHNAGPGGFTRLIQVCTTCSKLAPAEIRLRATAAGEQQRLAAARERAAKDAALLDKEQLEAVEIEALKQKAEVAGVSMSRVGKAQAMTSPRRALVALVIEANLLKAPLTSDEIRRAASGTS